MKNKILVLSLLIVSAFVFSACTVDNQDKSTTTPTTVETSQETGNETEAELLKQLNADVDETFNSDLGAIETELGN